MIDAMRAFDRRECIACGLCLEVCPTYLLRRDEGAGPRGRIRLMDLLAAGELDDEPGVLSLEECVGCLACQARCPAGAPFGAMLDEAHASLASRRPPTGLAGWLSRWTLKRLLPRPRRILRLRPLLKAAGRLGLLDLPLLLRLHRLPGLGWLAGLRYLPRRWDMGPPAPAPRRGAPYLFFRGCVNGLLFPAEERAARRLLGLKGGHDLVEDSLCCGAVHRHAGETEMSLELARGNIAAYENRQGLVVVAAAGCGAALKSYGEWLAADLDWAERARRFSARVKDLSEVLVPEDLDGARLQGRPRVVVYDDPCHARHAQGIAAEPRQLLDAVTGLERRELPGAEHCCGAGGSYFLRQPELSRQMIETKRRQLEACGAQLLLTANPGCRLQWQAALQEAKSDVAVRHPAEVLAEALSFRLR